MHMATLFLKIQRGTKRGFCVASLGVGLITLVSPLPLPYDGCGGVMMELILTFAVEYHALCVMVGILVLVTLLWLIKPRPRHDSIIAEMAEWRKRYGNG